MIQDNMKYCTKKLEAEELFMVKKGLEFAFFYGLKFHKILKWKYVRGKRGREILADIFC